MTRRVGVPDRIRERNEKELFEFYYENEDRLKIEQYDKYHFRIRCGDRMVDVWPVRKRYYNKMMNESRAYHHPRDLKITLGL